jgi:STE24 endopeptidase
MTGRAAAMVALVVLGIALVAVVALTTPWSPLPHAVPGGRVAPAATTDFTPVQIARENAYHRAVRPPAYAGMALGLLAAAVLGLSPYGARLVAAVARPLGGGWAWQAVLGGIAVSLVVRVVALPFDAWGETVLRRYGLSTRDWGGWALDLLRAFGVSTVVLAVVVLGCYALVRATPTHWWVGVAVGGALLVLAGSFLYPVLVEPVFNKFTPLAAGPLRDELLDLARSDGVPVQQVLVADASRRTTALNAYVSGFGASRRIVLYDTLLRPPTTPAEVRLIVAHELGHAKRQDVLHGTLVGMLAVAAAACAGFLVLTWAPLLARAGVATLGDPRSVALVLFVVTVAGLVTAPGQLLGSRRIEARADVHSLDLTRDPTTFVSSFRRLAVVNLSDLDPNPVVYALFASHPTTPQRIALARNWAKQQGVAVPAPITPP